ncbi:hypothetical protein [Leucobacter salsicius]|uniref:hypothetical protein n=1 Tax=Leucobacter salsicius TaxID=664638 RepID=UPI00037D5F67|nr:hypothetical protein [Leucobacter salsicius]
MSNLKFAVGVVIAGALAFGANFAGMAITAPMLHGIPTGSSSGQGEPTDLAPGGDQDYESLLIGRWQAPEPANQEAFVEFSDHGIWSASDGCNGAQGDWSVEDDGTFDGGVGGAMTLIACDNVAIPFAVWDATRVQITADDELILTSENGEELLLVRTGDEAFTIIGSWMHEGGSADEISMVEFATDGTWVGGVGCAEFTGTWTLGVDDKAVTEGEDAEPAPPVVLSGPRNLFIGPKPADAPKPCADGPKEFVLNYDTAYVFYTNEDGSFELGSTEPGELADQPTLLFERG